MGDSDINLHENAIVVPQFMPEKPKQCSQCSFCCRSIAKIWVNNPAVKEFIKARGLQIADENSKVILVLIPHHCPQLEKKQGKWICGLHSKGTKPRVCRINPEASLDDFRTAALDIRKTLGPNCPWREESV